MAQQISGPVAHFDQYRGSFSSVYTLKLKGLAGPLSLSEIHPQVFLDQRYPVKIFHAEQAEEPMTATGDNGDLALN